MKRRKISRRVLVEALESRVLLSASTATLNVNTNPFTAVLGVPLGDPVWVFTGGPGNNGSSSGGSGSGSSNTSGAVTITWGGGGVLTGTGTLTIDPIGGTLTINPPSAGLRLQSSGDARVLTSPTLTVSVSSTTLTPVTYSTADGGTVTAYIQGPFPTVWPAGYQITGGVGTPVLGTPFTATPTGIVELLDGDTVIASATLDGNQAAFQPVLSAGTHQLSARYMGDAMFGAETSNGVTQTITRIPTALQLSTSASSVSIGSQLTVSIGATAQDASSLNGQTVTLYDGTTTVGTATISNGSAAFTLTATKVGTHSLYASLTADDMYAGSTSSAVNVTVNASATVLTLGVWQNDSTVTFTATASGPDSVAAAPTGTINFYDGSTLIGSATLGQSNGVTLAFLGGSHHFSAEYDGDANFLAATADSTFNVTAVAPSFLTDSDIPNHHAAIGHVDILNSSRVAGWAVDQDIPTMSLVVSVYVDGVAVAYPAASINRPGLTALYGSADHGFDVTLPALSQGLHRIDVYAEDYSGAQVLLASRTVSTVSAPTGWVDSLTSSGIAGWAFSSSAGADPIQIRYTIDQNASFAAAADGARGDLQAALGSSDHGFAVNLPGLTAGNHTITVDAFDSATGASTRLATRTLTVSNAAGDSLPMGSLDIASNTRIAGWVLDPAASTSPLQVRIDIDGVAGTPFVANVSRPDLAAHFGSVDNGFDVSMPALAAGSHRIDIYAYDPTTHAAVFIAGRNTVTAAPTGVLDILAPTRIAGWAYAASTPAAPVEIRVDVDGMLGAPVVANVARADLAFLGADTFAFDLPTTNIAAGSHRITVSVIDPISGEALQIGAKTVLIS